MAAPALLPRPYGALAFGAPGGLLAPPPAVVYPGLIEALVAQLGADATFTAAFPGGVNNDAASRDTALPLVSVTKSATQRRKTFKAGYSVEKVTVHVVAVAAGAEAAEAAARTARARFLPSDTYTPPPLAFADGVEPNSPLGRFIPAEGGGESTTLDPQKGWNNEDVYTAVMPIVFTVARGGS